MILGNTIQVLFIWLLLGETAPKRHIKQPNVWYRTLQCAFSAWGCLCHPQPCDWRMSEQGLSWHSGVPWFMWPVERRHEGWQWECVAAGPRSPVVTSMLEFHTSCLLLITNCMCRTIQHCCVEQKALTSKSTDCLNVLGLGR